MKYKKIIKAVIFVLLFVVTFSFATRVVTVSSSDMEYQWMTGIYHEPENSLDAVYLGSSNCFAFFNSNAAWHNHGINVYTYACSAEPLIAAEYLIKEARKTQPDSVYIVNINTLGDGVLSEPVMHRLVDFMPLSKNKIDLINYVCDIQKLSFTDRLEYFFPIIKYHSKWSSLTPDNFSTKLNEIKGGDTYPWFLDKYENVTGKFKITDKEHDISEALEQSLNNLLDYCDSEKLKILFVTAPRVETKMTDAQKINRVERIITERGYTVLDLIENHEDIGLDETQDYYNTRHTNIHGSIKYTDYLSKYLINKYGFTDKRGKEGFESWDKSFDKYSAMTAAYALPFEWESESRTALPAPEKLTAHRNNNSVIIRWGVVSGAEKYAVFRKTGDDGKWCKLTVTDKTEYTDLTAKKKAYHYTVVPMKTVENELKYGDFDYVGAAVAK